MYSGWQQENSKAIEKRDFIWSLCLENVFGLNEDAALPNLKLAHVERRFSFLGAVFVCQAFQSSI